MWTIHENKERIKKFKETVDSRYLSNKLDKACFQHGMAYGDFKDLNRRTAANKVWRDEAFNMAKNLKYEYQYGFASMNDRFLD